jgi:hypothetical protein|nr:PPC domain-containing DNA-binding protein [uncultured Lachnoanaerobaculum sp.]
MEYKRYKDTIVVRIDKGEDIIKKLLELAIEEDILFSSISGLGAVDEVVLGIFDTENKKYISVTYTGDFEITSLVGSLSRKDGKPYIHAHMSIGNVITNKFVGGHLNKAIVSATAEIILTVVDMVVERELNKEIGLNLFKL